MVKELVIVNSIALCSGGTFHKRHLRDIKGVVIHRIDVGRTAEEVAKFFEQYPSIGKMAYTFFIRKDGTIEQALPLTYRSPGGIVLNENFVHIALDGDFRVRSVPPAQAVSLVKLTSSLCAALDTLHVQGHMETVGSSSDPNKDCPGEKLNIAALRQQVIENVKSCQPLEGVVL